MSAIKSLGTTLVKIKSGSETENLTIADLTNIGRIGIESDEIDTTTLDSPNGFKEFIAGFKDAGEVPISGIIKSEDAMEAMLSLADSQKLEKWEITAPNGATWDFDGFVKMFEEGEATVDGVRNFNGTIRISGKPVYTSAEVSA